MPAQRGIRKRAISSLHPLIAGGTLKKRGGAAAHPYLIVLVAGDVDTTRSSASRALGRRIRACDPSTVEEPLSDGGVEAASDRIFEQCSVLIGEERPQLKSCLTPLRIRA